MRNFRFFWDLLVNFKEFAKIDNMKILQKFHDQIKEYALFAIIVFFILVAIVFAWMQFVHSISIFIVMSIILIGILTVAIYMSYNLLSNNIIFALSNLKQTLICNYELLRKYDYTHENIINKDLPENKRAIAENDKTFIRNCEDYAYLAATYMICYNYPTSKEAASKIKEMKNSFKCKMIPEILVDIEQIDKSINNCDFMF